METGDEVFWRGNKYTLAKITDDRVKGMIDKKYHLYSHQISVPDAILDSLEGVVKYEIVEQAEYEWDNMDRFTRFELIDEIREEDGLDIPTDNEYWKSYYFEDLPKDIKTSVARRIGYDSEGNTFAKGGGVGSQVDLFEDYKNIPSEVKVILDKYEMEDNDYPVLEEMKQEVEAKGYTFDYGLDAEPYGLRKKGTPINHIRGFEEMEDGGAIEEVVEFTSLEDAEKWSAANQRDEYGVGGFILGSAVGGYVGYKIGRAREMKKGFSTEKRVAKKIKKAIKDRRDKRSQRMYGGRACQCTCCPACNGGWGINTQW